MLISVFEYRQAKITVRRADVRARLLQNLIYRHFTIAEGMPEEEFLLYSSFATFMTQASVEGDLGFPIPAVSAPHEIIVQTFESFLALDGGFYDLYRAALNEVSAIVGDPELAPGEDSKKKEAST